MMTVKEIMAELESLGSESIKKILAKHGVKEPFFGVKIEYLKPIKKRIKKDYQLAIDLYATGNADAMYLAGLIADDEQMTKNDLQNWVEQAISKNISEYTVPWVTSGSNYGYELATEWINSPDDHIAAAGWSTLGGIVSLKPDDELDVESLRALLNRVSQTIHHASNRVRYTMNGFVIAVGSFVTALHDEAIATANEIGQVDVDMNGTACKLPDAVGYINKVKDKGLLGRKKKTVKC
jgi:hypothetical protein